jgi:hypothetical protein
MMVVIAVALTLRTLRRRWLMSFKLPMAEVNISQDVKCHVLAVLLGHKDLRAMAMTCRWDRDTFQQVVVDREAWARPLLRRFLRRRAKDRLQEALGAEDLHTSQLSWYKRLLRLSILTDLRKEGDADMRRAMTEGWLRTIRMTKARIAHTPYVPSDKDDLRVADVLLGDVGTMTMDELGYLGI